MKLEYLFTGEDNKEQLSTYSYKPSNNSKSDQSIKIESSINDVKDSDKWIFSITINGNDENTAKHLSYINDDILKFEPTTLTNECSEYFNKRIFPLVNEFERKLRKYLYLKIGIYNTGKTNDEIIPIKDKKSDDNENKGKKDNKNRMVLFRLETMEFGELYTALFTDENVIKNFYQKVNSRISSKKYYEKILSEIEENTLWDKIKGCKDDDQIKDNFLLIAEYRNDTMHAHNITYSEFCEQRKLFKSVNVYLEEQINSILAQPASIELAEKITDELYDKTLPEILRSKLDDVDRLDMTNQQIKQLTNLAVSFKEDYPFYSKTFSENIASALSLSLTDKYKLPDWLGDKLSQLTSPLQSVIPNNYYVSNEFSSNLMKLSELLPSSFPYVYTISDQVNNQLSELCNPIKDLFTNSTFDKNNIQLEGDEKKDKEDKSCLGEMPETQD